MRSRPRLSSIAVTTPNSCVINEVSSCVINEVRAQGIVAYACYAPVLRLALRVQRSARLRREVSRRVWNKTRAPQGIRARRIAACVANGFYIRGIVEVTARRFPEPLPHAPRGMRTALATRHDEPHGMFSMQRDSLPMRRLWDSVLAFLDVVSLFRVSRRAARLSLRCRGG